MLRSAGRSVLWAAWAELGQAGPGGEVFRPRFKQPEFVAGSGAGLTVHDFLFPIPNEILEAFLKSWTSNMLPSRIHKVWLSHPCLAELKRRNQNMFLPKNLALSQFFVDRKNCCKNLIQKFVERKRAAFLPNQRKSLLPALNATTVLTASPNCQHRPRHL